MSSRVVFKDLFCDSVSFGQHHRIRLKKKQPSSVLHFDERLGGANIAHART